MSRSNYDRAKLVLQSIVQGVHPATGAEISQDSVVNNAEVLRAIVVAVSTLEAASLRATRRAMLPKSVGKPWTELEDATLTEEFARGSPIDDIAKGHHRTPKAIEARLEKPGLLRRTTVDGSPLQARDTVRASPEEEGQ